MKSEVTVMLTTIKDLLKRRRVLKTIKHLLSRDSSEMLNMLATMRRIRSLLNPEDEMKGLIVKGKTGLHLKQQLETHLDGSGVSAPLATDSDLERELELLDKLPPQQLARRATKLGRLAHKIRLEGGDPENIATLLALRLLSGWLKCKSIVHTSKSGEVIKVAQNLEQLHYTNIRSLLRIFRGENR